MGLLEDPSGKKTLFGNCKIGTIDIRNAVKMDKYSRKVPEFNAHTANSGNICSLMCAVMPSVWPFARHDAEIFGYKFDDPFKGAIEPNCFKIFNLVETAHVFEEISYQDEQKGVKGKVSKEAQEQVCMEANVWYRVTMQNTESETDGHAIFLHMDTND